MKKKFLILQARPDEISDLEFDAILKHGGLSHDEVERIRMEEGDLPDIDLEEYAAVIVGGSPYCVTDEEKTEEQKRLELQSRTLLENIIEKDFPYLGACYGHSLLSSLHGGKVEQKGVYAETPGGVTIHLTEAGKVDPLLAGLPEDFRVFAGHKESCTVLPDDAVLLASSDTCPHHIYRIGENVYSVQFHPELDIHGIQRRIEAYKYKGYFPPEQAESLKQAMEDELVTVPFDILKRFVDRYKDT